MIDKPITTEPEKPRRRWYQFRLRTLLIAVVLVGSACGYVAHEARIVAQRKQWESERLTWLYDWRPFTIPAQPSLIRRWLGDKGYAAVQLHSEAERHDAESLFPEARFIINEQLWPTHPPVRH